MTTRPPQTVLPPPFPDHTQLPEENGEFVKNFQEHPQSILLTDSIGSVLQRLHPDGQYAIGQDCGIYWRETNPPERGAEAPDWFYVPRVPPKVKGKIRRSYVLWREFISPSIALEFASGDGSEERDKTPLSWEESERIKPGKFWVYEQIMRMPYYGIYEINRERLEVYRLMDGFYRLLEANERGHYPIEVMGVELGLWEGSYQNQTQRWVRWWDSEGNLLLTGSERAETERERAEIERERAETERDRAQQAEMERDAEAKARREAVPKLLGMGLTPEQVAEVLSLATEEVRRLMAE
ncbi:Uma2 family endonuclease [Lusitaniella coriacea LEGE 07157]|uniref:Uma2 family endonuclease n=1 Tax=Lusitaniella coriacea LEGE 07157 TaxID=945747 RepID=A0A8J7JC68_9CYAN|nr:Uma2 family endonuclease [Lusitaniella coriacea]MBE9117415.1 Uma2 family endonuclease [Lusitaniella coriacea LEGE 07157]